MIDCPCFIRRVSKLNASGLCGPNGFFLGAANDIKAKLLIQNFAEIYFRPVIREIHLVPIDAERIFPIHLFHNMPIEILYKGHTLMHVAIRLIRLKLRVILHVLARLAFITENAADLKYLGKSRNKETLLP